MSLPSPLPAFPGVEPHLVNRELGVYLTFTRPEGAIFRYAVGSIVTRAAAEWVVTEGDAALRRFFPDATRFLLVQDFSPAASYTPEARRLFTDWGHRIRKDIVAVVMVPPPINPMFRVAITSASLALRGVGVKMALADSLEEVIDRYQLKAA